MQKMLLVDPGKCTGCRMCEVVCSVKKEGVSNPTRARINVVRWDEFCFEMPMVCQQCETPVCATVCPTNALSREEELGRVNLNYDLCIGCKMCVAICPFGGMAFDTRGKTVIKCDLCDGDPTCVRFCEPEALQYVDATTLSIRKKREAAGKLSELMEKFARV